MSQLAQVIATATQAIEASNQSLRDATECIAELRAERDTLEAANEALAEALQKLADIVEARERGDDEAVPASLRNPSAEQMAEAVNAARAAVAIHGGA